MTIASSVYPIAAVLVIRVGLESAGQTGACSEKGAVQRDLGLRETAGRPLPSRVPAVLVVQLSLPQSWM